MSSPLGFQFQVFREIFFFSLWSIFFLLSKILFDPSFLRHRLIFKENTETC